MEEYVSSLFFITPLIPHSLLAQNWLKISGTVTYSPQPDIEDSMALLSPLRFTTFQTALHMPGGVCQYYCAFSKSLSSTSVLIHSNKREPHLNFFLLPFQHNLKLCKLLLQHLNSIKSIS